jgi:hypothetical protein
MDEIRETGAGEDLMYIHKQVLVEYGHERAFVDEGMAPLILALWQNGISTTLSCQENKPGIAWVQFLTPLDAKSFLDIVAEYEEGVETLYNRITNNWGYDDGRELSVPPWEYTTCPWDLARSPEPDENDETVEEYHDGKPAFLFLISVRFPVSDLPVILDRLQHHLSGQASR